MEFDKRLLPIILAIVVLLLFAAAQIMSKPTYKDGDNITWSEAVQVLRSGEVGAVFQTHSLGVSLQLKSGARLYTKEPEIDEIFREIEKCGAPCRNIVLATE